MRARSVRVALFGGFGTVLTLCGGLIVGAVLGNFVFGILPSHGNDNLRIFAAALPALIGMMLGSLAWGRLMGRIAKSNELGRMGWAGAWGFAPVAVLVGMMLQFLESIIFGLASQLPLYRLFTLIFVPATFLVAAVASAALGLGLRNRYLALSLAWRGGLAAAIAFLVVNLIMEARGWQVGAPQAADHFTMVTVLLAGALGAAVVGGAVLGLALASNGRQHVREGATAGIISPELS